MAEKIKTSNEQYPQSSSWESLFLNNDGTRKTEYLDSEKGQEELSIEETFDDWVQQLDDMVAEGKISSEEAKAQQEMMLESAVEGITNVRSEEYERQRQEKFQELANALRNATAVKATVDTVDDKPAPAESEKEADAELKELESLEAERAKNQAELDEIDEKLELDDSAELEELESLEAEKAENLKEISEIDEELELDDATELEELEKELEALEAERAKNSKELEGIDKKLGFLAELDEIEEKLGLDDNSATTAAEKSEIVDDADLEDLEELEELEALEAERAKNQKEIEKIDKDLDYSDGVYSSAEAESIKFQAEIFGQATTKLGRDFAGFVTDSDVCNQKKMTEYNNWWESRDANDKLLASEFLNNMRKNEKWKRSNWGSGFMTWMQLHHADVLAR